MRYKIYFGVNGFEDSFIVEGETMEELREKTTNFFKARGLDIDECYTGEEKL